MLSMPLLIGIYCKIFHKSKLVMSLHGTDVLRINSNKIYRFCLKIPNAIVTVGDSNIQTYGLTKTPVKSIGNGVDLNTFTNEHIERNKQFIQVASLRWQKGQEYLYKAFAKFLSIYNEYKLIMVGVGEDKDTLIDLSEKLGIKNNIEYRGMLSREEVSKELNRSMIFILSSITEGFPKVIIEAMATGTPVISTDVGCVKSVIKDSGVIVQAKNENELFNAMKRLVDDNEYYKICSEKSELYSKDYTWENVEQKLNSIYFSI